MRWLLILVLLAVFYFWDTTAIKQRCLLPQKTGTCKAHRQRWWYDAAAAKCVQFIYTGCEGNDNRFKFKWRCLDVCRGGIIGIRPKPRPIPIYRPHPISDEQQKHQQQQPPPLPEQQQQKQQQQPPPLQQQEQKQQKKKPCSKCSSHQ